MLRVGFGVGNCGCNYRSPTQVRLPAKAGFDGCPRTGEAAAHGPSRTIAASALNLPLPYRAP